MPATPIDTTASVRLVAQHQQLQIRITTLKQGRDQAATPTMAVAWPIVRALCFVALYLVRKELGREEDES